MKKYIFLLFFCWSVSADNPPEYFVMRIAAKKGAVEKMYFTYYNAYVYTEENCSKIMRFDSTTKSDNEEFYNQALKKDCYLPDSIYCSDSIVINNHFAFAKGYLLNLKQFDSIRIDSILWGETEKMFQMLDTKTYKIIVNKKVFKTFDIFLGVEEYLHKYLHIVSFDSLWNSEYFMSQFEGYDEFIKTNKKKMDASDKQFEYWEYYQNVLKRALPKLIEHDKNNFDECYLNKKNLPVNIRIAIEKNKIIIIPFEET